MGFVEWGNELVTKSRIIILFVAQNAEITECVLIGAYITYYDPDEKSIQEREQAKDLYETIKIHLRLLLPICYI